MHKLDTMRIAVFFLTIASCQGDSPDLTISRIISVVVGIAVVAVGNNTVARPNAEGNTESSTGSSRNLVESGPVRMKPSS